MSDEEEEVDKEKERPTRRSVSSIKKVSAAGNAVPKVLRQKNRKRHRTLDVGGEEESDRKGPKRV